MHRHKQLLPWGATTVIEEIVARVSGKLAATVVVLGHNASAVSSRLSSFDVQIAINEEYRRGMLSSVKCGLAAAAGASAYLVFLGDQPVVDGDVIDAVVNAHAASGKGIVIPTFAGKRGHPVLIGAEYADEILALEDDQGLNRVTRGHAEDTLEVPVETETVLEDMDTPEDYRRIAVKHGGADG